MLDVGFSEILLTSATALIVLGPERFPKVARQVGNWMGRARAMARQLSEQLEREVSADELLKSQSKPSPSANLTTGGTDSRATDSRGTDYSTGGTNGAAFDPTHNPSIHNPSIAPPASDAAPPPYGLDAASTTAAAMHASDPPASEPHAAAVPDPNLAPSHTATDAKPPHE
jgi:Tat protein translocase TatB subunit